MAGVTKAMDWIYDIPLFEYFLQPKVSVIVLVDRLSNGSTHLYQEGMEQEAKDVCTKSYERISRGGWVRALHMG